ncbi:hypothetical protein GRF59_05425 [Paenibacillus sp. HJL G12]|uniref:Uncharacterized protein n=1 Tax=Paenibacillus dendrobii TaxID=2691084 RepID=A0A7X3IFQ5_9BACL|nr:hypothetical protein [Paenibacillus dendrobii]MWV43064.1 hypothetical protein [Paenibacillus dendrobii]
MAFGYKLGDVVNNVTRIVEAIQHMEQGMHHASSGSLDALRRNKAQLENVLEFIMELEVGSSVSLEAYLAGHKQCIQDCIGISYNAKKPYIGRTRVI